MKKRLISLVLTIVMLFSVMLTSCSSSNDDAEGKIVDDASRYATTLNMYIVAEEGTTPEAAAAVFEQINKITKAKFKTQLNIYFTTSEEEHYAIIDGKIADFEEQIAFEEAEKKRLKAEAKAAKARGETVATTKPTLETEAQTTAEETVVNEWGLTDLKYPAEGKRQLDIIYLSGYDRYMDYIDREVIERLNDELSSGSKKLKDYINPTLFNAVSVYDSVYAIPNNFMMGEYTYLLINKELAAKYSYDVSEFSTLTDTAEFVADVAKHEKDVTPVYGVPMLTNLRYFSLDSKTLDFTNDRSVMAAYVAPTGGYTEPKAGGGLRLAFRSIFSIAQITDQMKTIQLFKDNNYIKEGDAASKKFAVAVMKGDAYLTKTYGEEYEMIVLENPMVNEQELFAGMFAVSAYTKDLARSMEIITYINTNPELRNLLQYGIEGVNYTVDEETGVLTRLNNDYMMDIRKTGNAFVAHPEEGMPADIWEYGKKQNLDARIDPLYTFTYVDSGLDEEMVGKVAAMAEPYFERYEACNSLEELTAFLDTAKAEVLADENMTLATSIAKYDKSPNYIYNEWFNTTWPPLD